MPPDSLLYDLSFGEEKVDVAVPKSVSAPTTSVEVMLHQLQGYGAQEAFARETADSLEAVLNSAKFKSVVLDTKFEYHNLGLTSQQIYEKIMLAREEDGPGGKDRVLDLRLRTITLQEDGRYWINACNRSTIGIDGSGSGISAVCPNWLTSTAESKHYSWLAAHFIHEYMHLLNFRHPDNKSESVPYKIHAIVENLLEDSEMRR